MLRKRLIASACFIVPVLGILWLDLQHNFGVPGLWMVTATLLLGFVIAHEFIAMVGEKTAGANRFTVFLGVLLCHLAMLLPVDSEKDRWLFSCIALVITMLAALATEMIQYHEKRRATERVALTMFATIYSGWLLSFVSATRVMLDDRQGVFAVFSILFVIKMSDAGAYFTGKKIGRRKLAPVLSPGKTIEGLIGGMIAAVFAALLAFWVLQPIFVENLSIPLWKVVGYAVSIAAVGVFGDLCESMFKRDMSCKDSSTWLPGLGGIMDTADSIIVAAPAAYFWWAWGGM